MSGAESREGRSGRGLGRLCRASWAWGRTWAFTPRELGALRAVGRGEGWPDLAAHRLSHSGGQTVGGEGVGHWGRGDCAGPGGWG